MFTVKPPIFPELAVIAPLIVAADAVKPEEFKVKLVPLSPLVLRTTEFPKDIEDPALVKTNPVSVKE